MWKVVFATMILFQMDILVNETWDYCVSCAVGGHMCHIIIAAGRYGGT